MAGAGYKLFNTGDVLTAAQVNTYLQEQTVMVFASAAARTTALSGVLAEGMMSYLTDTDLIQYYNGSTWTTVNTDQTPLTTKGDLFTYSTADARLGVGANETRLVADSAQTTGLKYVADTTNYAINAKGDLLAGTAADTLTALTVGADYTILQALSTETTGLRYTGGWTTYTPTWTGSVTNPTIGNGILTGGWRRIGSLAEFWLQINFGSTTTAGSGNYTFGLPTAAFDSTWVQGFAAGLLDSGVAWYTNYFGQGQSNGTNSAFQIASMNNATTVGATTPFTFASNDAIFVQGRYRVA